jgi:hypothetical protein
VFDVLLSTTNNVVVLADLKCRSPTLEKWEDDSLTPKMGTWELARTPETSKFDCKGQNTSHQGVLYIIRKLLKCRCRKWACMSHLDICSQVMTKRKVGSQINNLTLDHQKSGIDLTPMGAGEVQHTVGKLSTRATILL